MTSPSGEAKDTVGGLMHSGVVTCRPTRPSGWLPDFWPSIVSMRSSSPTQGSGCMRRRDRSRHRLRLLAGELDGITARDAASEPTITVRPDLDLREASATMARQGVTHIVVTAQGDATPIGILSSLDIAKAAGATSSS